MLPFTFNKTSLKEPQKIMDSFVIRSSPYTKGNQRYLSSKDGGMGCISLFHHAKASSQFWIKKLINGNSIANRCIHYALATINLEPKDLIYAAKWELKIISYFLKNNLGLIFWAEIVLRLDEFRQAINSAAGQTDHESEMLTHIQNKIFLTELLTISKPITQSNILRESLLSLTQLGDLLYTFIHRKYTSLTPNITSSL